LSILKDRGILTSKRQGKHAYYFIRHASIAEVIGLLMDVIEH